MPPSPRQRQQTLRNGASPPDSCFLNARHRLYGPILYYDHFSEFKIYLYIYFIERIFAEMGALDALTYSLLTDTNNISKPPFRSCSILVPIRYASFRQAVPIFRFVSIFLIKNAGSELSVQYIQRHVDKLAPRWVGRRRSAARHRLSMSWSCYDDDQLSCCSVFTEIGSRRSRTDQRIGDGGRCMEHISRCVVVVS